MKKITYFLMASALLTLASCGNTKENTTESKPVKVEHQEINLVDFIAENSKENWKLSVTFDGEIVFTDIQNEIQFSADENELQVAQGADIVNIYATNNEQILRVSIDIAECQKTGKRVNIMYRKADQKEGLDYSGCGFYKGDIQLHDIWALHQLNGETIKADMFPKETPHFEINLTTNKISGFAGCNQVNGSIAFEYNKMLIEPLSSTRMYCGEASKLENEILEILRSNPVYNREGLMLTLESAKGSLILKKVD